MKKYLWAIFLLMFLAGSVFAFGGQAPKKEGGEALGARFLIDDFESGSLKSPREWWTFDIQTAAVSPNTELTAGDAKVAAEVGKYSLLLKGNATRWYAGGCGTYFAAENQNLAKYGYFQLDIYGNGPGSGTIKLELFDDDNGNWQVEQDPAKGYVPLYDDKYVYAINVDWVGWKKLSILLEDFVDDNAGVGDDVWNPEQTGASGGLLQLQCICLAGKSEGGINFNLDNVALSVSE